MKLKISYISNQAKKSEFCYDNCKATVKTDLSAKHIGFLCQSDSNKKQTQIFTKVLLKIKEGKKRILSLGSFYESSKFHLHLLLIICHHC